MNPGRCALMPLLGWLMLGSRTCGWEGEMVVLGADGGYGSAGGGVLDVPV